MCNFCYILGILFCYVLYFLNNIREGLKNVDDKKLCCKRSGWRIGSL